MRPVVLAAHDEELRLSLLCHEHQGFLASVAYLSLHLVPRVPLHSAGWQSARPAADSLERVYRVRGQRLLARCQLDLCDLGGAAWAVLSALYAVERKAACQ